MGRARATLEDAFTSTFGNVRGSAAAQRQRDVSEREERERGIASFAIYHKMMRRLLEEALPRTRREVGNGRDPVLSILIRHYRKNCRGQDALAYRKAVEELVACTRGSVIDRKHDREANIEDMMVVVVGGDPSACTGLTAPATEALGQYFAEAEGRLAYARAEYMLGQCFYEDKNTLKLLRKQPDYQRLEPLAEGLAAFCNEVNTRAPHGAKHGIASQVLTVVAEAPPEALVISLRGFVEVLEQAYDRERFDGSDIRAIIKLLRECDLQVLSGLRTRFRRYRL